MNTDRAKGGTSASACASGEPPIVPCGRAKSVNRAPHRREKSCRRPIIAMRADRTDVSFAAIIISRSSIRDESQQTLVQPLANRIRLRLPPYYASPPRSLAWLEVMAVLFSFARRSLYLGGSVSEMGASYFNGNPRAKNLVGKELLVEFAWCEGYAETLSRFAEMLANEVAFPDRFQWPEQPKILSRDDFSGESRRPKP